MRLSESRRGLPVPLLLPVLLPLFALSLAALAAAPALAAEGAKKPIEFVDGVPDTGQFLPNSELLGRVGERRISVFAFREAWFLSDPQVRPRGDSLGRAEYLTNMMRKDVLGQTALAAGYPLNFEERATLRAHRATLVTNRFFELEVMKVPEIPEDSLRRIHGWMRQEIRAVALTFPDRAAAEAALASLKGGRTTWDALMVRLNPGVKPKKPGELGWLVFQNAPIEVAVQLWTVEPGRISGVVATPRGYQIFKVYERRPHPTPDYQFMRDGIRQTLQTYASGLKRQALLNEAKRGMDFKYDTTNVKWASGHYFVAVQSDTAVQGKGIFIEERVPDFAPQDTSRTIASWKDGGRLSLGHLASAYSALAPVMRPPINTPEQLADYADAIALEPRLYEMALQRGYDRDSVVNRLYQRKLEEMLVTRMVEDSCFTRIQVSPQERHDYYDRYKNRFYSWPVADVAMIVRDTKALAEAVQARLAAGEPVAAILRADSLAGDARSGVQRISGADHHPLEKLYFEELRPGQNRVIGPDKNGQFACVQLLDFDPGQLLPYAQVETVIDESIRNIKAEAALNAFVDRLKARYKVELYFDKLMRVRLTTPGADEHE